MKRERALHCHIPEAKEVASACRIAGIPEVRRPVPF
jgi:hypothetical protein